MNQYINPDKSVKDHIKLIIHHIHMATEKDVFSVIAPVRNSPQTVLAQLVSDKYGVEVDVDEMARLKSKFNKSFNRGKRSRQTLSDVVNSGGREIIFSPPKEKFQRCLTYDDMMIWWLTTVDLLIML